MKRPLSPIAAVALVCLAVLPACGDSARVGRNAPTSETSSVANGDAFWSLFTSFGDLEVESYATLKAMKGGADSVVVARAVDFVYSREIRGDAPEDVLVFGSMVLEIERQLGGTAVMGEVPLEFDLPVGPEEADSFIAAQRESLPQGDLVIFLHAKRGASEAGLYRPVNSLGLWAATTRAPVDTPISETRGTQKYRAELVGVDTMAKLADRVATL